MSCTTAINLRGPRRRAAALPYMVAVTFGLAAANNNAAPVINANPANCGALASLTVPNTTFTSATYISPTAKTPGYCDLKATVAPQTDIEIWLPDQWFQRYLHLGGGGFDGAIPNLSAPPAAFNVNPVSSGYVVAGSNGGHRGSSYPGASFAPDKGLTLSYAQAALHDTDVVAKVAIQAYYGQPARYRYWDGCSNGGRGGGQAAGKYLNDYDGVLAGAGVYGHDPDRAGGGAMPGLVSAWVRSGQVAPVSPGKGSTLYAAQLAACDAADGISDGIISNPEVCHFDPAVLRCTGASSDSCLTDAEINSIKTIRSDNTLSDGTIVGAPFGLGDPTKGLGVLAGSFGTSLGQGHMAIVTGDLNYDLAKYDLNRDFPSMVAVLDNLYDFSPDLDSITRFLMQSKKIVFWAGWDDVLVPPYGTVRFYLNLNDAAGAAAQNARLFMLPGVQHCGGGQGADSVDILSAVANWVENDVKPDNTIVASKVINGTVTFTQPVCSYPEWPFGKRDPTGHVRYGCVQPTPGTKFGDAPK